MYYNTTSYLLTAHGRKTNWVAISSIISTLILMKLFDITHFISCKRMFPPIFELKDFWFDSTIQKNIHNLPTQTSKASEILNFSDSNPVILRLCVKSMQIKTMKNFFYKAIQREAGRACVKSYIKHRCIHKGLKVHSKEARKRPSPLHCSE